MVKFYSCRTCGNLIEMISDSGAIPVCCGNEMEELIPGSTDGAKEKHIPVCEEISPSAFSVTVGALPHPMDASHYIEWILVETANGVYRKHLSPGRSPQAVFYIPESECIRAIYAYCNLHGLWICVMN